MKRTRRSPMASAWLAFLALAVFGWAPAPARAEPVFDCADYLEIFYQELDPEALVCSFYELSLLGVESFDLDLSNWNKVAKATIKECHSSMRSQFAALRSSSSIFDKALRVGCDTLTGDDKSECLVQVADQRAALKSCWAQFEVEAHAACDDMSACNF